MVEVLMSSEYKFNERAGWAKRRQVANSPTRIIRAAMEAPADKGTECKYCGVWEDRPSTGVYICRDCMKTLMPIR